MPKSKRNLKEYVVSCAIAIALYFEAIRIKSLSTLTQTRYFIRPKQIATKERS